MFKEAGQDLVIGDWFQHEKLCFAQQLKTLSPSYVICFLGRDFFLKKSRWFVGLLLAAKKLTRRVRTTSVFPVFPVFSLSSSTLVATGHISSCVHYYPVAFHSLRSQHSEVILVKILINCKNPVIVIVFKLFQPWRSSLLERKFGEKNADEIIKLETF